MKNSVIPIIGEISFRTDCISEKITGHLDQWMHRFMIVQESTSWTGSAS
jgi:hypothetical protein